MTDPATIDFSGVVLPQNVNMPWVMRTMRRLGIENRGVCRNWCYKEFFMAYPDYLAPVLEFLEQTSTGNPSLVVLHLHAAGLVDDEYAATFIASDTTTPYLTRAHCAEYLALAYGEYFQPLAESLPYPIEGGTVYMGVLPPVPEGT